MPPMFEDFSVRRMDDEKHANTQVKPKEYRRRKMNCQEKGCCELGVLKWGEISIVMITESDDDADVQR